MWQSPILSIGSAPSGGVGSYNFNVGNFLLYNRQSTYTSKCSGGFGTNESFRTAYIITSIGRDSRSDYIDVLPAYWVPCMNEWVNESAINTVRFMSSSVNPFGITSFRIYLDPNNIQTILGSYNYGIQIFPKNFNLQTIADYYNNQSQTKAFVVVGDTIRDSLPGAIIMSLKSKRSTVMVSLSIMM